MGVQCPIFACSGGQSGSEGDASVGCPSITIPAIPSSAPASVGFAGSAGSAAGVQWPILACSAVHSAAGLTGPAADSGLCSVPWSDFWPEGLGGCFAGFFGIGMPGIEPWSIGGIDCALAGKLSISAVPPARIKRERLMPRLLAA